jgi:hypothetical protein
VAWKEWKEWKEWKQKRDGDYHTPWNRKGRKEGRNTNF